MACQQSNLFQYRAAQTLSRVASTLLFRCRTLRNEIKNVEGPYTIIANHQAALDFVNLIGATRRPIRFVISQSFFSTLPIRGTLEKIGVIPKQQFQTAAGDLRKMRAALDAGQPLAIYPAGLMCEDGLSTPIPAATYKFLKWLGTDIYMARTEGTYFVMPKWAGGIRPGRTTMDIYRLFTKEELADMTEEEIRARAEPALLYDAYREQEQHRAVYMGGRNLQGLEQVLYRCPHCGGEHTVAAKKNRLYCTACGYEQVSDRYGFLHNRKGLGEEIRYVSDWSRRIYEQVKDSLRRGENTSLTEAVEIRMVDTAKKKFVPVGTGTLSLNAAGFTLQGTIGGEATEIAVSITNVPTLPFSPGKHLELQQGSTIYRCIPRDGRLVMKFIHMVKAFYELRHAPVTTEI